MEEGNNVTNLKSGGRANQRIRRSREAYQGPTLTKSRDVIIAVDNDHSDRDHYDRSRSE
jgi:hypothetical protein